MNFEERRRPEHRRPFIRITQQGAPMQCGETLQDKNEGEPINGKEISVIQEFVTRLEIELLDMKKRN